MPVAPRLRPVLVLSAAVLAGAAAGCDAEPGFPPEAERATLADVRIAPAADSLRTDAPTATVPLSVAATLGGGPATVRVLVRYQETDTLTVSTAVDVEPGPFQLDVPFTVPRGATGDYRVQVATEGADGRPGDEAAAVVQFAAASLGPPRVTRVDLAASVERPAQGARDVPVSADVEDPDGVANVAVVLLVDPEGGGVIGRLYDQGDANGAADETAGDGRFTAALQISAATAPGTYALAVVAVDRAEGVSEAVPVTFTVR